MSAWGQPPRGGMLPPPGSMMPMMPMLPPPRAPPPPGPPLNLWKETKRADGKVYWFIPGTQTTTWKDPYALAPLPVGWTEHTAPDERKYYYNAATKQSSYVRPQSTIAAMTPADGKKVVIRVKVPDTPWTLARTADGRVLYYNSESKKSQWVLPDDLSETELPELPNAPAPKRPAVDPTIEAAAKRQRMHAPSQTAFSALQSVGYPPMMHGAAAAASVPSVLPQLEPEEEEMDEDEALLAAAMAEEDELAAAMAEEDELEGGGFGVGSGHGVLASPAPPAPPPHGAAGSHFGAAHPPRFAPPIHMVPPPPLGSAAGGRAHVSAEDWNTAQFKAMLRSHSVGAFSSWDHEITKFRDDQRFRLLKPKARRAAFESYQIEEAKEERGRIVKEKEDNRVAFISLLRDAKLGPRSTFQQFKSRHGRDPRFKRLDKNKEKLNLFNDALDDLKSSKSKPASAADTDKSEAERRGESIRQREATVQRQQASVRREREHAAHKHFENDQETVFRQILLDLVRTQQVAWVDAELRLQDDPRWDGLFALDNSVKRRLFDEHRMSLARKRTDAFAAAFDAAHGMTIGTLWDEARALVCTDPRFVRFSEDDTEREEEYTRYVRGRTERARKEYRDLLKETRSITHTTLNEVNDEETGEARKRELLSILGRDSRYGELDSLGEAREELLNEYLVEIQRKGAPLPPTADPIMAKSHP